jgi:hypothetical protein
LAPARSGRPTPTVRRRWRIERPLAHTAPAVGSLSAEIAPEVCRAVDGDKRAEPGMMPEPIGVSSTGETDDLEGVGEPGHLEQLVDLRRPADEHQLGSVASGAIVGIDDRLEPSAVYGCEVAQVHDGQSVARDSLAKCLGELPRVGEV